MDHERKRPSDEEHPPCKRNKARVEVALNCANHTTTFAASGWKTLLYVLRKFEEIRGFKCSRLEVYLSNAKEPEADGQLKLSTTLETLLLKAKDECIQLTCILIPETWNNMLFRKAGPAIGFLSRLFCDTTSHEATACIEQAERPEHFMSFNVPQNAQYGQWRIGIFATNVALFVDYSLQDSLRLGVVLATDCNQDVQAYQIYEGRPEGLDRTLTLCLDFGSLVLLLYGSAPDGTVQRIGRMPLSSVVYTEELAMIKRLARWTVFQHPSAKPIANDQLAEAGTLGFCATSSEVELAIMHDLKHGYA